MSRRYDRKCQHCRTSECNLASRFTPFLKLRHDKEYYFCTKEEKQTWARAFGVGTSLSATQEVAEKCSLCDSAFANGVFVQNGVRYYFCDTGCFQGWLSIHQKYRDQSEY